MAIGSKVRLNSVVYQLRENWQQYGFESKEEARSYIWWITRQCMQLTTEEQSRGDNGFRNAKTPQDVLQRYDIDEFRADEDIRNGRVYEFPDIKKAIEFLKS